MPNKTEICKKEGALNRTFSVKICVCIFVQIVDALVTKFFANRRDRHIHIGRATGHIVAIRADKVNIALCKLPQRFALVHSFQEIVGVALEKRLILQ